MAIGIGASGILGLALETVAGTYLAPTKFVPFESESLAYTQETNFRRPIRVSASVVGAVQGNSKIEGDISMEAFEDIIPYFLMAARTSVAKTGTAAPFTYEFKGTAAAVPTKTLSIVIVRSGNPMAYTGCIVSSFTFTIEDGTLKFNVTLLGRNEAAQTAPVPVYTDNPPFGAGSYDIQIPTATTVFDCDGFEFQVEDNADAQYRLRNDTRGMSFAAYGERAVTMSTDRDFDGRVQYDAYKALTSSSITLKAVKGANASIEINMPVAYVDEYTVNLSGQGDLVRASCSYVGTVDATGNDYSVKVTTSEDIVLV